MCFSASASFGAAVVLTAVAVVAIKKTTSASQLPFAVIPLIFGIQQLSEGFVWLALTNNTYTAFKEISTYTFLFFAQSVWPLWLPFAIFKMENNTKRKQVQKIWVAIGAILSVYLGWCLFTYHVDPTITGLHISYNKVYPAAVNKYCGFIYIIATIVPAFFSTSNRMWTLGITILVSYIITAILYQDHIVSVWCFFASFISVLIAFILYKNKNGSLKVVNRH